MYCGAIMEVKISRSHSIPNLEQSISLECSSHRSTSIEPIESSSSSGEIIQNIVEIPPTDNFSTSAVLHYCKRKILVPYHRLLSLLGWRPIIATEYTNGCARFVSLSYTLIVMMFALVGYVLQYAACFRRDVVDGYKLSGSPIDDSSNYTSNDVVCKGTALGLYFVPSILHFSAYCYTWYMLRVCESEQLQVLMERVFLQAFYLRSNFITQPKLLSILRLYFGFGLFWIFLTTIIQTLHVLTEYPTFTWMQGSKHGEIFLIIVLVLAVTWHDVIHATIIITYGIQCQLLCSFARGICERVKEKSITLQDAIKEIGEIFKIIKHLNEDYAVPASLMMLQSAVYSISGLIWALTTHNMVMKSSMLLATNFMNIILWLTIFMFPLIQATRLSSSCHCLKKLGIYLQTRPFGYQEMPQKELDSFLLYTMSVNIRAKLFRVPIKPPAIFGFVVLSAFSFLLLAQLEVIKIGI